MVGLAVVACVAAYWLGLNEGPRVGVWYCVDAQCCVEGRVSEEGWMDFKRDADRCGEVTP